MISVFSREEAMLIQELLLAVHRYAHCYNIAKFRDFISGPLRYRYNTHLRTHWRYNVVFRAFSELGKGRPAVGIQIPVFIVYT